MIFYSLYTIINTMTGVIFNIQRFSIHDGPGIRTTVFFKGCPARCAWCHNPESFSMQKQLQYYKERCIGCGKCIKLCPNKAHSIEYTSDSRDAIAAAGMHLYDRNLCKACGICAEECYANALVITGKDMSVDEVLGQVLADKLFYDESGGGVTLSGGEPLLQADFCKALLMRFKAEGIHTNLQTAGFYAFDKLECLLPFLDLVMYDIKGMSDHIYKNYIKTDFSDAASNASALIIDNLLQLDKTGLPFIVRTPCIKGINDFEKEIKAIAQMLSKLKNLKHFSLLPCHNLARLKYEVLGMEFNNYESPSKDHMEFLKSIARQYVKVDE